MNSQMSYIIAGVFPRPIKKALIVPIHPSYPMVIGMASA